MTRISQFVGLDVHKDTIAISVAQKGREPAVPRGSIPNDSAKLVKRLAAMAPLKQVLCCYEAGPTGFALCRQLRARGIQCEIVAPSMVPERQGDRVKTDKRDSTKLAHFLRSGDLAFVWLPDEETEALRDLVRARDDAKITERVARQRLSSFLLRHDRIYPGKTAWTQQHLRWIKPQKFVHESQQRVITEYLHAVEQATATVERVTADVEELVRGSKIEPLVNAFLALKGVRILTAAGIAAALGDLRRFPTARNLMSFVGLAVREDSSGKRRRQFAITKTGNSTVRRLLVEAAWNYRYPPKRSYHLMRRSEGLPPRILEIAWAAQHRLHRRYRRLLARGKPRSVTVIAVARELAGFFWAIGQEVKLNAA